MTSAAEGREERQDDAAGPETAVPDEVHRRIARPGPDGTVVEGS